MIDFFTPSKPIHLVLTQDLRWALNKGFPWVYSTALEGLPKAPSGSLALIKDRSGTILARAIYDPHSHLAARILSTKQEPYTSRTVEELLKRAARIRDRMDDNNTNCFRFLNGEGDMLPGVVCDIYYNVAVLRFDGAGPFAFWNAEGFAQWIADRFGLTRVYLRHRNDASHNQTLLGDELGSEVEVLENGRKFVVDFKQGQKTGFFLDQRDNRLLISRYANGRSVLNLFGYTGGFSIYAGTSGASVVTTVDIAQGAIACAERNWALNQPMLGTHHGVVEDVFDYIERQLQLSSQWDMVIVDPPSFAKSESQVSAALLKYETLFARALRLVKPQGIFAAASCSSRVTFSALQERIERAVAQARRKARVLAIQGQPRDHPYPLACEDLRYLKFFLLEIE
jgi:23S rRNA (cytosine1962-C5)-methyltransferase